MCPGRNLVLPYPTCTPWASINKSYKHTFTEATLLLQNLLASEAPQSLPSHHYCGGVNIVIVTFSFNQMPIKLNRVSRLKWERTDLLLV